MSVLAPRKRSWLMSGVVGFLLLLSVVACTGDPCDTLVFEAILEEREYEIWMHSPCGDYGATLLKLRATDLSAKRTPVFVGLGSVPHLWSFAGKFELVTLANFSVVVVAENKSMPLLIVDLESGEYLPKRDFQDEGAPWLAKALEEISNVTGGSSCMGILNDGVVTCRDRYWLRRSDVPSVVFRP